MPTPQEVTRAEQLRDEILKGQTPTYDAETKGCLEYLKLMLTTRTPPESAGQVSACTGKVSAVDTAIASKG